MITFDKELEQYLLRLTRIDRELPRIAEQVRREALSWAISAANLNIYNTAPGAYERTGQYLAALNVEAAANPAGVFVRISNSAPYAAFVEFGQDQVSPAMLQQAAASSATPLTVGRSGQQWWIAGPVLTSAQVYAQRRLVELFWQRVRAAR